MTIIVAVILAVFLVYTARSNWLEHRKNTKRIQEKRAEVAALEEMAVSLYDGTRLAEEWNPELGGIYGGQDIAAEEAFMALDDVRRELAALREVR